MPRHLHHRDGFRNLRFLPMIKISKHQGNMPVKIISIYSLSSCWMAKGTRCWPIKIPSLISDELAKKLFGTAENITGKMIHFQHETFFVSGIFEKLPSHSSQQFDFVMPLDYFTLYRMGEHLGRCRSAQFCDAPKGRRC